MLKASKLARDLISKISGHLSACLMARHKEYYKGEGGGFPQIWAMVSLMNICMLVARPCTKGAPTTH
jgi:hypothetical protein